MPNGTALRDELVLLLPGWGMAPIDVENLAYIAAYSGHRVLSIPWDTQGPIAAERCTTLDLGGLHIGGDCSWDCSATVREEIMTGVDSPLTEADHIDFGVIRGYEGRYLSGIEQRIARNLQALHEADIDDPSSPGDDWGWSAYCTPDDTTGTRIEWSDIIVSGFSMGASMAQYIGFTRSTAGVFAAEGHGDYCDVPAVQTDPRSGYVSDWIASGTNASGAQPWFSALHEQSDQMDLIPLAAGTEWPAAFPYLGLSTSPDDYDAWAESYPYEWGENVIFTNQEHVVNDSYHSSMGHDDGMPDAVVGGVAILGPEYVDDLHLFDAYLGAMCAY